MSRTKQWQRAGTGPLAIRISWGVTLLVGPAQMLRTFGGADDGSGARLVMRI